MRRPGSDLECGELGVCRPDGGQGLETPYAASTCSYLSKYRSTWKKAKIIDTVFSVSAPDDAMVRTGRAPAPARCRHGSGDRSGTAAGEPRKFFRPCEPPVPAGPACIGPRRRGRSREAPASRAAGVSMAGVSRKTQPSAAATFAQNGPTASGCTQRSTATTSPRGQIQVTLPPAPMAKTESRGASGQRPAPFSHHRKP